MIWFVIGAALGAAKPRRRPRLTFRVMLRYISRTCADVGSGHHVFRTETALGRGAR